MSHTWRDVPDPRDDSCPGGGCCEVEFPDHRWSHIHDHVADLSEPWDDWLTPPLATRLRNTLKGGMKLAEIQTTRQEVSERMEQAAKQCLGVPLAVLYQVAQPPKPGKPSLWELTVDVVLPCGAKLCLRQQKGQLGVLSCYFLKAVCAAPRHRRWRLLVQKLIHRYARDNGDSTFSAPDPSAWPKPVPETAEVVNDPRFRTEGKWGLDPPQREPWDKIPDPWPPPGPPPGPRVKLGPRLKY